jgi:hypothetical protein
MSVHKYRSVDGIPAPPEPASAAESLASACVMGSVSALFGHDARAPRGVMKFRSVEAADADRAAREAEITSRGERADRRVSPVVTM